MAPKNGFTNEQDTMKISDVPYDWVVKLGGVRPMFAFFDDKDQAKRYAKKMNGTGYYARVINVSELRDNEPEA